MHEETVFDEYIDYMNSPIEKKLVITAVSKILEAKEYAGTPIDSADTLQWALTKLFVFKVNITSPNIGSYVIEFFADGMDQRLIVIDNKI